MKIYKENVEKVAKIKGILAGMYYVSKKCPKEFKMQYVGGITTLYQKIRREWREVERVYRLNPETTPLYKWKWLEEKS